MQPNLEKQEYRGRENLSSRFFEVSTVSRVPGKPLKLKRFLACRETVEIETVSDPLRTPNTPLKQGVNEKRRPWRFRRYEISG